MPAPFLHILETPRLLGVQFTKDDSQFILQLLNDPGWISNIGDRNIESVVDATNYIENGPIKSYAEKGFGPLKIIKRDTNQPIGMAGLFKRDGLDHPDIGFAFLTDFCGQGFGTEISEAIIHRCETALSSQCLLSITSPSNLACQRLLDKLDFKSEGIITLPGASTKCILYKKLLRSLHHIEEIGIDNVQGES